LNHNFSYRLLPKRFDKAQKLRERSLVTEAFFFPPPAKPAFLHWTGLCRNDFYFPDITP